jgi:HAD superfamily hydrolase (TIGR01509 family)
MRFRLVILDMDDTLVRSGDTAWRRAEERLFAELGSVYTEEKALAYKGMNAMDVGRTIHRLVQPAGVSADECGRRLRGWLVESFRDVPEPLPGADELIRALAGRCTLGIASGSPPEAIRLVTDRYGWTARLDFTISTEAVPRGKPAPDIFAEVARRTGIGPADALVVEDSLVGVRAARAAGMACWVVPSTANPDIPREADRVFANLADVAGALAELGRA